MAEETATAAKPALPKVLVTQKELKIALGLQQPDAVKEGAKVEPTPVLDFLKSGKGIVAKEYAVDPTSKKSEPTGKTRVGKKALEYVLNGFGENARYRGMYVDTAKAKPEIAEAAIAVSKRREQSLQIRNEKGKAASAAKKSAGHEM